MKKLSLVLALLLVFTCGVLAACGDDADTSSTPSTTSTASKPAESKAPTSSAAPSDDASSEEASSEAESRPVVENPVLVSAGLEYEGPVAAGTAEGSIRDRGYHGNLTDGIKGETWAAAPDPAAADWFGLFKNGDAPIDSNALVGYAEFVFDLGKVTDLAEVKAWIGRDASLNDPTVFVYISNDKTAWTEIGELTADAAVTTVTPCYYAANLAGEQAQYVKVKVNVVDPYWAFIGEIEIYADGDK